MSITKIDDLNYNREYMGLDCRNDNSDLEFTKNGLDIDCDTLDWDAIRKAHKIIFGDDIG